jgi:hypothetical protein
MIKFLLMWTIFNNFPESEQMSQIWNFETEEILLVATSHFESL